MNASTASPEPHETPAGAPGGPLCRCGHARAVHEHYRRGRDCGICGAENCPGFRAPGGFADRLRSWLGRPR